MAGRLLSIGELARRTGVSVSALRFYEARGLLMASRNEGGHRRFDRSDIRRVSFVVITQRYGFTIDDIAQFMATLPPERTPTKADWARLSKAIRGSLNDRIDTLIRMRDRLDGCIGCGCLSLKSCALYNPDDQAARRGAGPRYVLGDKPARAARSSS